MTLNSFWLSALMLAAASPLAAQRKVELPFTGNFLGQRVWPKTGELLKGLDHLGTGPVDTAFAGTEFLYPGQSLSIKLSEPERWFYMRALGTAGARRGEILFTDYRLELRDSGRIDSAGQAVFRLDALTLDNTPNLRWAGDLDRDRRLDLLLQVPIGGYSKRYLLLLSSRASRPELVKAVASFDVFDC